MGGRYPERPSVALQKPDALPRAKFDWAHITAAGITQNNSSVFYTPAYDTDNSNVYVRAVATFMLTVDTTGKTTPSAIAGEHKARFALNISGLVGQGQWTFPDFVSVSASDDRKGNAGPPVVGLTRRNADGYPAYQSNEIDLVVVAKAAASVFDVMIKIEYFCENVNLGHGVLFPDYA